ncbi:MAG: transcriptional repressor LexA [Hyphomicrobiales bacterium]
MPKRPSAPGARRKRPPKRRAPSEDAILAYIGETLRDRGRPPTLREIGDAFGIASTNGVRYYLARLEQAGKIHRDRFTSRGIELAEPPAEPPRSRRDADLYEIPLLGRVAAGAPILAEENIEDVLIVDGALVRPGKHFALRVRGDSMKNAGIFDGDTVIVKHDATIRSGDIAVVVIGEEATVKRYFPRKDKLLLLPENDEFEPIEVTPDDPEIRVAGKVVGVFRKLES